MVHASKREKIVEKLCEIARLILKHIKNKLCEELSSNVIVFRQKIAETEGKNQLVIDRPWHFGVAGLIWGTPPRATLRHQTARVKTANERG